MNVSLSDRHVEGLVSHDTLTRGQPNKRGRYQAVDVHATHQVFGLCIARGSALSKFQHYISDHARNRIHSSDQIQSFVKRPQAHTVGADDARARGKHGFG